MAVAVMLTAVAIVWVAVVLGLVYGLCRAAGRPRPTPPRLDIEPHLITALHEEAERPTREAHRPSEGGTP